MAIHPVGTPIIRTVTTEIDEDTDARSVIDLNSFAIPPHGTDEKVLKRWRKEALAYFERQLEMMVDGHAHVFEMKVDEA